MEPDDPTEREIVEACARIQRTWSDEERHRRRWGLMPGGRRASCGAAPDVGWTAPVISVTPDVAAALQVM